MTNELNEVKCNLLYYSTSIYTHVILSQLSNLNLKLRYLQLQLSRIREILSRTFYKYSLPGLVELDRSLRPIVVSPLTAVL